MFRRARPDPPVPSPAWVQRVDRAIDLITDTSPPPWITERLVDLRSGLLAAEVECRRVAAAVDRLEPDRARREFKDALAEQRRSPYAADDARIARLRERYDAINKLLDRHDELRLGIDRTLLDLDVLAATAVQRYSLNDLDDNDEGALSEQIEHLRIDLAALDAARAEVRLL